MKTFVMAFLKRGPNRPQDSIAAADLLRSHLDNILTLAQTEKLVVAGPFIDTGDLRGIYIFDVATIEEAKKLTETDPAIQQSSLVMELKLWYGSAALLQINEIHKTIQKTEIAGVATTQTWRRSRWDRVRRHMTNGGELQK